MSQRMSARSAAARRRLHAGRRRRVPFGHGHPPALLVGGLVGEEVDLASVRRRGCGSRSRGSRRRGRPCSCWRWPRARRAGRPRPCPGSGRPGSRGRSRWPPAACGRSERATSFSRVPAGPLAPVSSPPWPGSMTIVRWRGSSGAWGRAGALGARDRGRRRAGRRRRGVELQDEPRRALLLVRLHLLEAASEGDAQDVVAPALVLDPVHDPSGEALLLERHLDEVPRDRDEHLPFLLHHAEGDLLAGVEDDADQVPGDEGVHAHPRHGHAADQQRARGGAPFGALRRGGVRGAAGCRPPERARCPPSRRAGDERRRSSPPTDARLFLL